MTKNHEKREPSWTVGAMVWIVYSPKTSEGLILSLWLCREMVEPLEVSPRGKKVGH